MSQEDLMQLLTKTVSRYLFAIPFIIFGIFHFMNAGGMAGMVPGWLPGGVFWVYLTGLALIVAPISLFIGKKDQLAMLLLALMLVIFALLVHLPGGQSSMPNLLKDLSLAGAALTWAGLAKDQS